MLQFCQSYSRAFIWGSNQLFSPALEDPANIQKVHREQYTTAVTDAVLLPDKATVAVSLRNTNFLRLFSLETHRVRAWDICGILLQHLLPLTIPGVQRRAVPVQEVAKVNMNAQGDYHVSFTASHLALSPCGKYILVSTDGARIIMFKIAGGYDSFLLWLLLLL